MADSVDQPIKPAPTSSAKSPSSSGSTTNATSNAATKTSSGSGCGPMAFVIILTILFAAVFGTNAGLGWYGINCGGMDIMECADEIMNDLGDEEPEGSVTANGPYSYKDSSVNVSLTFPLSGGAANGTVSGDCGGKLTGNFDGKDNGIVSGNFAGTCNIFFVNVPVNGTYTGTVNKESKVVPVTFQGGGGGIDHSDGLTLSF